MPLSFRSYRGFPCVRRCDEYLWYVRQTTAFDPNRSITELKSGRSTPAF